MMRPVLIENVPFRPSRRPGSAKGLTFVEVMLSMAITIVVLGSIFALLARGFRTADAEFQRSDLQAQARHALDQISRDLLAAGSGLPPEFPAFTPPNINPELDASGLGPEAIEIIGGLASSAAGVEPWPMVSFDGYKATTERLPPHIGPGDLVLLYDDQPTYGTWVFGLVSSIEEISTESGESLRELTIKTAPGDTEGETTLPPFIAQYNRSSPASGFITPVTVVSYKTAPTLSGANTGRVLWRQVNWGEPTEVAFVEDLQFRYFMGTTIAETHSPPVSPPRPRIQGRPPILNEHPVSKGGPKGGPKGKPKGKPKGGPKGGPSAEIEGEAFPPFPQTDPSQLLDPTDLVTGVGISVTSRSNRANLEGSTIRQGQTSSDPGFLRVTFASRVAARNVMYGLSSRENSEGLY